jgi:chaperonin GroEL (HSP60 family)
MELSSVVVLAGALIEKAEELITKDVHPTIIVDGYRKSALKSIEFYSNLARKIDGGDKSELIKVAKTSMQTKLVSRESSELAELVVNGALQVSERNESGYNVDIDDVKVEKKAGGSLRRYQFNKGNCT